MISWAAMQVMHHLARRRMSNRRSAAYQCARPAWALCLQRRHKVLARWIRILAGASCWKEMLDGWRQYPGTLRSLRCTPDHVNGFSEFMMALQELRVV
jgi:hypothetical protein